MASSHKLILLVQAIATACTLFLLDNNLIILAILLTIWTATFRRISLADAALIGVACLLFTAMNIVALKQGIFSFNSPDVLGLPVYEFLMWGFYTLHTKRLLGEPDAAVPRGIIWLLLVLFMAAFSFLQNPLHLMIITSSLLVVCMLLNHTRKDLEYTGYMIGLGLMFEIAGVYGGHWSYPAYTHPVGIPLWTITLWGGTGYFLHRLALPLLVRIGR